MNENADANRGVKVALNAGIALFFVLGLAVGVFWEVFFGTMVFAVGVVLLAVRGYMGSGDKSVTGVLIFVAFAAVAIQAIEYFLAP